MRLKLDGIDKFREVIASSPKVAVKALSEGLYSEGNLIMTESKRIVPVDVGTLRASGTVTDPETSGTKVTVTLGYGGAASAYALVQHERTDFHHPGQGEAKYLEKPVKAAARSFGRNVGVRAGKALERMR